MLRGRSVEVMATPCNIRLGGAVGLVVQGASSCRIDKGGRGLPVGATTMSRNPQTLRAGRNVVADEAPKARGITAPRVLPKAPLEPKDNTTAVTKDEQLEASASGAENSTQKRMALSSDRGQVRAVNFTGKGGGALKNNSQEASRNQRMPFQLVACKQLPSVATTTLPWRRGADAHAWTSACDGATCLQSRGRRTESTGTSKRFSAGLRAGRAGCATRDGQWKVT